MEATHCPLDLAIFCGLGNRVSDRASPFVWPMRTHLKNAFTVITHEILAALASRRFIKRHLNSPD
jgi:hypothetical protein